MSGSFDRARLVKGVKTPLNFYTLGLIVVEGILVYTAISSTAGQRTYLIVVMSIIFVLLVLAVWFSGWTRSDYSPSPVAESGIVHVSVNREHSAFPKPFWEQASATVSIFAPTFWRSIMGLLDNKRDLSLEIESLMQVGKRLGSGVRILLMSPHSAAFEVHRQLLKTAGDIPNLNAHEYIKKLKIFENLMRGNNVQLRFYDVYPTVSFVIVDNTRVKVDYVLPHHRVVERPLIEYQKGGRISPTIFDCFFRLFEELWKDTE
jgi:hypothetical protein